MFIWLHLNFVVQVYIDTNTYVQKLLNGDIWFKRAVVIVIKQSVTDVRSLPDNNQSESLACEA